MIKDYNKYFLTYFPNVLNLNNNLIGNKMIEA